MTSFRQPTHKKYEASFSRSQRYSMRFAVPKDAMSDGLSLLPGVEIWSSAGITAGIDVMLEFKVRSLLLSLPAILHALRSFYSDFDTTIILRNKLQHRLIKAPNIIHDAHDGGSGDGILPGLGMTRVKL
jgi:hypothetical protein